MIHMHMLVKASDSVVRQNGISCSYIFMYNHVFRPNKKLSKMCNAHYLGEFH